MQLINEQQVDNMLKENPHNSMNLREITDKNEWENFLASGQPHTFLQSWNWGEFSKSMGHKIWRLGMYEDLANREAQIANRNLVGVALVIKITARRGTFLFVPQGPILRSAENFQFFVDHLKNLAKDENCGFVRISPILLKTPENEKLFRGLGFRKAPIHMHAETMWILDVVPSENELLKNMRKTTRYLIRKAQSEGVEIIKSSEPEHLEIFQKLYEETARRQRFSAYGKDYIKGEFESFRGDNQIQVFLAKYNDEFTAGAMIIFYGDSAFYHQGASSDKYSKIPAPYLLQWEIIRETKRRGLKYYNFWGISPDDQPRHPWAGLSLFKKGFGGFSEAYLPAQDLVLKKSYWITYLIEKIRKKKRGL